VKPIPVVFHIGPLQVHTYGIGLAITFWVAYRYFEKRLRDNGYPWQWLTSVFLWVIVAAILGARIMSVLANLGYYGHNPGQIIAIWHGGLSSFGGLMGAIPTAIILARRRCPELPTIRALDLVAPVLIAAWGLGRLLGPQLMVAGGGHRTNAWYGMYYADQAGKRLPVPIFQAIEMFIIFLILLRIERWVAKQGGPLGFVAAAATALYGVARFNDEYNWLAKPGHLGSFLVELAGVGLAVGGFALMTYLWLRWRANPTPAPMVGSLASIKNAELETVAEPEATSDTQEDIDQLKHAIGRSITELG